MVGPLSYKVIASNQDPSLCPNSKDPTDAVGVVKEKRKTPLTMRALMKTTKS